MAISREPLSSTATAAAMDMMEKMKREQDLHRMQMERNRMMRELVDAWHLGGDSHILRADSDNLTSIIKEKIEHHRKMIATLEWFAAHVALDKPEADVLVTRVVLEGLAAMDKNRDYLAPAIEQSYAQAARPWK